MKNTITRLFAVLLITVLFLSVLSVTASAETVKTMVGIDDGEGFYFDPDDGLDDGEGFYFDPDEGFDGALPYDTDEDGKLVIDSFKEGNDVVDDRWFSLVMFWILIGIIGFAAPAVLLVIALVKMKKHPNEKSRWLCMAVLEIIWIGLFVVLTVLLLLGM